MHMYPKFTIFLLKPLVYPFAWGLYHPEANHDRFGEYSIHLGLHQASAMDLFDANASLGVNVQIRTLQLISERDRNRRRVAWYKRTLNIHITTFTVLIICYRAIFMPIYQIKD